MGVGGFLMTKNQLEMNNRPMDVNCKNDGQCYQTEFGTPLNDFARKIGLSTVKDPKTGQELPIIAALVDNTLKELSFRIMTSHQIEFIGINHPDGRRCYIRSLCFVLQNAVRALYPDKTLVVDHSLPSGLYCEIKDNAKNGDGFNPVYFIKLEEIEALKDKMKEIVAQDLPFQKTKMPLEETVQLFKEQNQPDKAELISSIGRIYNSVYWLDGHADTFHGPLLPSTGYLKTFDLVAFNKGFYIQLPCLVDYHRVMPIKRQSKIAAALEEYSHWTEVMNIKGIGSLNQAIMNGRAIEIINLSETFLERKYASIADQIHARKGELRVVFIAGPSSSGKTSSSLRLALQLKALGLNPKVIELDNYFIDREHTPRDENGDYDFESL